MPPRKRAAEEEVAGPTTRSAKAPKTEHASPAKGGHRGRTKKGPKANIAASAFKARALPLHINITHTPPVLADDGTVSIASTDPGFIGTTTLIPSTFATGSYGWKGNKRFTVELENPEGGEEKEKVHVMLTVNATVIGSKGAKEEEGEGEGGEEHVEEHTEEHVEEHAEEHAEGEAKEAAEAEETLKEKKETKETNGGEAAAETKSDTVEEAKEGE